MKSIDLTVEQGKAIVEDVYAHLSFFIIEDGMIFVMLHSTNIIAIEQHFIDLKYNIAISIAKEGYR